MPSRSSPNASPAYPAWSSSAPPTTSSPSYPTPSAASPISANSTSETTTSPPSQPQSPTSASSASSISAEIPPKPSPNLSPSCQNWKNLTSSGSQPSPRQPGSKISKPEAASSTSNRRFRSQKGAYYGLRHVELRPSSREAAHQETPHAFRHANWPNRLPHALRCGVFPDSD